MRLKLGDMAHDKFFFLYIRVIFTYTATLMGHRQPITTCRYKSRAQLRNSKTKDKTTWILTT